VGLSVFREDDVPEYDPDFEVPFYPITPDTAHGTLARVVGFTEETEIVLSGAFVVDEVDRSVLLAENHRDRSLLDGLFYWVAKSATGAAGGVAGVLPSSAEPDY